MHYLLGWVCTQCLQCICLYNYIFIIFSNYRSSHTHYKYPLLEFYNVGRDNPQGQPPLTSKARCSLTVVAGRNSCAHAGAEPAGRVKRAGCQGNARLSQLEAWEDLRSRVWSRPGGGVIQGSRTRRENVSCVYLQVALSDRGCGPGAGLLAEKYASEGRAGAGPGRGEIGRAHV